MDEKHKREPEHDTGSSPEWFDLNDIRRAIEAGNRRQGAMSPEQRVAEAEQEGKDEEALLEWWDHNGGKDQINLHPMIAANLRVARSKREPQESYEAAAMRARQACDALGTTAKPAEPAPEAEQERQSEALKPLVIQERKPRDIFEAIDMQMRREPMCIGGSLGSWRR